MKIELDVNVDPGEETVWLTIEQIAELFEVNKSAIVKHISNIYEEEELEKRGTVSKMETVGLEGNSEIIFIDNYIDRNILNRLSVKHSNVFVVIYTDFNKSKLLESDIRLFNNQYGLLKVIDVKTVHDRYIIIDRNALYNIGGSIKDLGKKLTTIHLLDSKFIKFILENI